MIHKCTGAMRWERNWINDGLQNNDSIRPIPPNGIAAYNPNLIL